MNVTSILEKVRVTKGSNAKKAILCLEESQTLRQVLKYSMDSFIPFHITKVPKVKTRLEFPLSEEDGWQEFFLVLEECAAREITGNAAIDRVYTCFSSVTEVHEMWMRKILTKHLAIGVSTKSINKIFANLIPTFEVSLAQKFEDKRLSGHEYVAVEPKLDGIRCFAVVKSGCALLYARSGKIISNFDLTIGAELSKLPDGCYDGEIMGDDFTSLMRQAYRKENVVTESTYLSLFDFLTLDEWKNQEGEKTCDERHTLLTYILKQSSWKYLKQVPRHKVLAKHSNIKSLHDTFVQNGFEGAMVKYLDSPYKFGRGYEVMKMKEFYDADLPIEQLIEGSGRHTGKLGSVKVMFNGVAVQVGSGFSDDLRAAMWKDKNSFLGRVIEVRYQEVTPDGSLRFPTFVCFRNDR